MPIALVIDYWFDDAKWDDLFFSLSPSMLLAWVIDYWSDNVKLGNLFFSCHPECPFTDCCYLSRSWHACCPQKPICHPPQGLWEGLPNQREEARDGLWFLQMSQPECWTRFLFINWIFFSIKMSFRIVANIKYSSSSMVIRVLSGCLS